MDPTPLTMKKQAFNGRVYHIGTAGYFANFWRGKGTLLHRAVWAAANGPIPEGAEIHHIDHDRANNALSNLQCVSVAEHVALHLTPERREAMRANMLAKVIPAARAWHRTEEGRAWHRAHARIVADGLRPVEYVCGVCGVTYRTKPCGMNKQCSPACRAVAGRQRRAAGVPVDPRRNQAALRRWREATCAGCAVTFRTQSGVAKFCEGCRPRK